MKRPELEELLARTSAPLRESQFLKVLRSLWAHDQEKILTGGMKNGDENNWHELKGFRRAVMVLEKALAVQIEKKRVESPDPTKED
jgi:hypothetical protein